MSSAIAEISRTVLWIHTASSLSLTFSCICNQPPSSCKRVWHPNLIQYGQQAQNQSSVHALSIINELSYLMPPGRDSIARGA